MNNKNKKFHSKRIVALIGVILLALMYLLTLVFALLDNPATMLLFRASLIGTFAFPILIWIYIWMFGKLTQKHTMADFDLDNK
jgi:hypothetical protein